MTHLLLAVIYMSFISLGLPDSLLGASWPSMYSQFDVPVSYAGIVSFIIAVGTVVSALMSERLLKRLGAGKLTAVSVAVTAAAIFGFSVSRSFLMLCLFAVPYGLGAGSVDSALNNYAAIHYSSRHMSWLHCMWGVGTIVGPYVISYGLTRGLGWNFGYRCMFAVQIVLTVILLVSLPLWKKQDSLKNEAKSNATDNRPISLRMAVRIPGAKEVMIAFFCYCALEQTVMLWASSYMVLHGSISEELAASFASLFFIGITVGRGLNGFLTLKFSDDTLIRAGMTVIAAGIAVMLLPLGNTAAVIGLLLIGLGCAPIYPCIIHSTPQHFGTKNSQSLVSLQIASAYIGICIMPPIFGLLANAVSPSLLPFYLTFILILMFFMHKGLLKKTSSASKVDE